MIRLMLPALGLSLCVSAAAVGQEGLVSGPQKDTNLPGPCEVFNINGDVYKDRFHCQVCEHGFDPGVMVFAKEPLPGRDAAFNGLARGLEKAIAENKEFRLHAFMAVLSPQFRSSVTGDGAKDREEIIKEVKAREELLARLRDRAAKLEMKQVILGCTTAAGPKTYDLNPRAEVTIIFYQKLRVIENYAFGPGEMTQEHVDMIVANVTKKLREKPAVK